MTPMPVHNLTVQVAPEVKGDEWCMTIEDEKQMTEWFKLFIGELTEDDLADIVLWEKYNFLTGEYLQDPSA